MPGDDDPAAAVLRIRTDDLSGPEITALLREHLASVAVHSPPESIHALGLDALRCPGITVWSAWRGTSLAGVGALQELDPSHGEIKSMRTASGHLRTGVGSAMVAHLLDVAWARGYQRVSLETGVQPGFAPARALYARFGFEPCGPFGGYVDDPNSVFMTRRLDPGPA